MAAYCAAASDAGCAAVATACAGLLATSAEAAAVKLSVACAMEFAECAGSSACSEGELTPVLAPLDADGSTSVSVAPADYR